MIWMTIVPNYPELKQVTNVSKKVEELMYERNPDSKMADSRFANVPPTIPMNDEEEKYFLESFQDLISQGVIMWGREPQDFLNTFPVSFSITTYGRKILESGEIIPHDPHGYLDRLKKSVPAIDTLVLMYVDESLQCYINRNFMASSVMLGVASEATFYSLLDSFQKCVKMDSTLRQKSEKMNNRMNLVEKFNIVYDGLVQKKSDLDEEIASTLEHNLNGIFNFIRLQRNESGHPTGQRLGKDQMLSNLTLFAMYCKTVYDLIRSLDKSRA